MPSFLSTYAVSTVLYVEGPRETPSLYPPRPIGGDTMPARRNRNSTLRCDADQIEREAKRLVDTYSDLILRLCYSALGSADDAQDICQDTLIKILQRTQPFDSLEHERAWVIRVALNACRDIGRTHANHPVVDLDSLPDFCAPVTHTEQEFAQRDCAILPLSRPCLKHSASPSFCTTTQA